MFAPTPSSLRLLRHSKEANLMKAIERNVADAGVYQHFYHIATRRLFFPQENCSISDKIKKCTCVKLSTVLICV